MNPSEKFRRFAAECETMSKSAKSPESKAAWNGIAERWIVVAELADDRYAQKVQKAPRHRRRSKYNLN